MECSCVLISFKSLNLYFCDFYLLFVYFLVLSFFTFSFFFGLVVLIQCFLRCCLWKIYLRGVLFFKEI
jgi:hypothetical protein